MSRNEKLACPMISRRGFEPYESPASGMTITSRKDQEKDFLDTNTMPTQDVKVKPQHRIKDNGR